MLIATIAEDCKQGCRYYSNFVVFDIKVRILKDKQGLIYDRSTSALKGTME